MYDIKVKKTIGRPRNSNRYRRQMKCDTRDNTSKELKERQAISQNGENWSCKLIFRLNKKVLV